MLPTAFGLLSQSLLNVSRVKTGLVTCLRLVYQDGKYGMHMYLADAKTPAQWEECGWTPPAPQLQSLEVFPLDCTVEAFAQKVSSQHVIVCYGGLSGGDTRFLQIAGYRTSVNNAKEKNADRGKSEKSSDIALFRGLRRT